MRESKLFSLLFPLPLLFPPFNSSDLFILHINNHCPPSTNYQISKPPLSLKPTLRPKKKEKRNGPLPKIIVTSGERENKNRKMTIDFQQLIPLLILTVSVFSILRLFLNRKTTRTSKLQRWWGLFSDRFHDHQFLKIPEFNDNFQENQLFRRVSLYLNSLESIEDSDFTNLFSGDKPNHILLSLNPNQTVVDDFLGARLSWTYQVLSLSSSSSRSFILRIRTRDKRRVLRPYLQYIHSLSDEIDQTRRQRRLYTNSLTGAGGRWTSVNFTHPATMETVAMDFDIKTKIKADLESFLKSKQYYHRLGRVWRRSYLLYGPSGTGKSSFVAAMAETLSYDVYDLDLSKVAGDADLKLLLLQTTPRSIILVEDFDRYVAAGAGGKSPVTMSGILNFMDGVVNSCCDERVMVFTMTTKDNIDPTVLRPGRVDVHIYFPLCDFNSFKSLASNYLGVREHKLFPQVEEIFHSGASLSPAEISELMMANRSSPSRALKSVISALQTTTTAKGEGGKGTPRTSMESMAGESGNPVDIGCRDGVKEIRNTLLYGILRRKSMRKSESFDLRT